MNLHLLLTLLCIGTVFGTKEAGEVERPASPSPSEASTADTEDALSYAEYEGVIYGRLGFTGKDGHRYTAWLTCETVEIRQEDGIDKSTYRLSAAQVANAAGEIVGVVPVSNKVIEASEVPNALYALQLAWDLKLIADGLQNGASPGEVARESYTKIANYDSYFEEDNKILSAKQLKGALQSGLYKSGSGPLAPLTRAVLVKFENMYGFSRLP